jgi:hypothetical protein
VNAPVSAPVTAAPQAAFDIFDQPVRRVNAPVSAPVTAAPQAAFDIFDQPVRRVTESSRPAYVPVPVPAASSIPSLAPKDQSPISNADELDEDVALAMMRLKKMTATGTDSDIPIVGDVQFESGKSDTQTGPDVLDAVRPTRRLRTPERSLNRGSEVNSNIESSTAPTTSTDKVETDIFQIAPPVRRLRASVGMSDMTSDTTIADNIHIAVPVETGPSPPTAPHQAPSALDIFDMPPPVRRLRRSPISDPDTTPAPAVTAADGAESVSSEPESSPRTET